jgi:cytochrome c2
VSGGERARGGRASNTATAALLPGDSARGDAAYERFGCRSCHGSPAGSPTGAAPPLANIGSRRSRYPFRWPTRGLYLQASLRRPNAYIVDGYSPGMPSSDSLAIDEQELYDLVAYLRALR